MIDPSSTVTFPPFFPIIKLPLSNISISETSKTNCSFAFELNNNPILKVKYIKKI